MTPFSRRSHNQSLMTISEDENRDQVTDISPISNLIGNIRGIFSLGFQIFQQSLTLYGRLWTLKIGNSMDFPLTWPCPWPCVQELSDIFLWPRIFLQNFSIHRHSNPMYTDVRNSSKTVSQSFESLEGYTFHVTLCFMTLKNI